MDLTLRAAVSGIIALALMLAGQVQLGLLAGAVFATFAVPWYYHLIRGALGYPSDLDI